MTGADDAKKETRLRAQERRQNLPFSCDLVYDVHPPAMRPKPFLLMRPFGREAFCRYRPTVLELGGKPALLCGDEDGEVLCAELLDSSLSVSPKGGTTLPLLHPDDVALLTGVVQGVEARVNRKLAPPRLTELAGSDVSLGGPANKRKRNELEAGDKQHVSVVQKIEDQFRPRKSFVHPTASQRRVKEVIPLLPNALLWTNSYSLAVLEGTSITSNPKAAVMRKLSGSQNHKRYSYYEGTSELEDLVGSEGTFHHIRNYVVQMTDRLKSDKYYLFDLTTPADDSAALYLPLPCPKSIFQKSSAKLGTDVRQTTPPVQVEWRAATAAEASRDGLTSQQLAELPPLPATAAGAGRLAKADKSSVNAKKKGADTHNKDSATKKLDFETSGSEGSADGSEGSESTGSSGSGESDSQSGSQSESGESGESDGSESEGSSAA